MKHIELIARSLIANYGELETINLHCKRFDLTVLNQNIIVHRSINLRIDELIKEIICETARGLNIQVKEHGQQQ